MAQTTRKPSLTTKAVNVNTCGEPREEDSPPHNVVGASDLLPVCNVAKIKRHAHLNTITRLKYKPLYQKIIIMFLEVITYARLMHNSIALAIFLMVFLMVWSVHRPRGMPPGPRGLPIIGSILSITQNIHNDFQRLAKKYGDIFAIKLGSQQVVVLNNYELIKEALVINQTDFAGRPNTFTGDMISEGSQFIVLEDYGAICRMQRKIVHSAIRAYLSGNSHIEHMVAEDAFPPLQQALEENDGKVVKPRSLIFLMVNNIIAQFSYGQKYSLDDPEFKYVMRFMDDVTRIAGSGFVADIIPWSAYIPTKATSEFKKVTRTFPPFMYKKLEEHKKKFNKDNLDDLFDHLIYAQNYTTGSYDLTDARIVQTVADVFIAGIDTTAHTLDYSMIYLVCYPDVQVKVAREIDDVVGQERLPLISDRPHMPYCDAVIHEIMRIRAVEPLAVPHKAMVDSSIDGYNIPKGTWLMTNVWAAHMDEKYWENPELFKPERFLTENGSLKPKQDSFFPFSMGRRVCVGESLAKSEIFLLFATLFQRFSFSKVPGKPLPTLDGAFSFLVLRAPDYEVIVKKRF
ncbi:steroid 17-alpha-hydroxylase/17,20 lyase-like [Saccoglossus kowalevskii]|uniref:Steroid 17-alpha-hydroxylase/17,20 lyase-like n=1 Tax=Saccoglossus kowalevskii TaxID=10224 RepID=A0ABM0GSN7_SACKO|nr:PREDICTED: steroid 17-alpha-hydroxylase/17,20 lyase-like [Saccoglossus kowalevskii]